uniref:Uncharacterized protein n=1 Tax=Pseudomonas phage vB_PaPhi_Mx1 TaxID=3079664 RepID=A0AAU0N5L7_9CAUD
MPRDRDRWYRAGFEVDYEEYCAWLCDEIRG